MSVEFRLSEHYNPLPKQREYHESPAKYKCYMGGVGSGKTTALVWEALLNSIEFEDNYGLVGRFTYPELRDTTMFEFFQILPDELVLEFKKTEHKLVLKNGSTIIFRHLEDPDKIKSLNLGFFAVDEMTEIPENVFLMLQSRLRRNNVPRRTGFGSTNPEGQDWVYNKFLVQHADDPRYLLVRAPTTENPYLPDDYVDDLISSFPETWQRRYIYGDPTAFSGQIVTTWNPRVHIIKPFDIPESWTRLVGLDHGTNNPTAVLWAAVHPEGFIIIYREHYVAGQIVEWHVRKIHELNGADNITWWYADPSIFNKTLQDPKRGLYSEADIYAEHGIHFMPGDNDVKSGLDLLISSFNVDERLINPFTGKQGSPRVFIFADCTNTIREIPQYRWKEQRVRGRYRNQPEEPEKANDHTVDVVRYLLMSKPRPLVKRDDSPKPFGTYADRFWDRRTRIVEIANKVNVPPPLNTSTDAEKIMLQMRADAAKRRAHGTANRR
jgi:PBSX family phage terminase large subunit